jgi:hypothetical protein
MVATVERSQAASERRPDDNAVARDGGMDVTSLICIFVGLRHGRCLLVAGRGLLGRNQTELNVLGSHVRQNAVSGVAVVVERI